MRRRINVIQRIVFGSGVILILTPLALFNADIAGDAFRKAGHPKLAISAYQGAASMQRLMSISSTRLADIHSHLSDSYEKSAQLDDAIRTRQNAIDLRTAAGDADLTAIMIDQSRMADVLILQGRAIEAEMILTQCQQQLRQKQVPDTVASAYILAALAKTQTAQGKWRQAIETFDRAIIMDDALMNQRKISLNTRDHLAALYARLGSLQAAERIAVESVEKKLKILGADNLQLAMSFETLGKLENAIGKNADAQQSFAAALNIYRKHCSSDPELLREIEARHHVWLNQKPIAQIDIDQSEDIEDFQDR